MIDKAIRFVLGSALNTFTFTICPAFTTSLYNNVLWLVLLAAFMMIATDLPYRSPRLFDGVWAVLAYPKLYGTILLWGVAMWAVWPQVRREDAYAQT